MLTPETDAIRGAEYGGYIIEEMIAAGGMGRVYRARHSTLNRTVALKLLSTGPSSNRDNVARFKRETEAVARLDHSNIVPIYEVGEEEGDCYFSMRLVEGPTLSKRQFGRETRSDFLMIAETMTKVANAVHYAHQNGILHRDIKPGNVLLDSLDEPFLTDFGLARFLEEDSSITATEAVLGTPHYMAPEQISLGSDALTAAADIYGLGAVLYELLTGAPPFQGESTLDLLRNVAEDEPARPTSKNRRTPKDLETIALRCLLKEPKNRYASAGEMAADLERFARGEPIAARPVSSSERLYIWARRRPLVASLVATVTVLLLVLGISGQIAAHREKDLREQAEAGEEILRHRNYQFAIKLAQTHINAGNPHLALPHLWKTDTTLRGWEWGHLLAQCPINDWAAQFDQSLRLPMAISKDGALIFAKDEQGALICVDTATQSVKWRQEMVSFANLSIDPKERYLAVRHYESKNAASIVIYDATNGLAVRTLVSSGAFAFAWSPTGDWLFTYSDGGVGGLLKTLSVPNWNETASRELGHQSMSMVADGAEKYLTLSTSQEKGLITLDAATLTDIGRLPSTNDESLISAIAMESETGTIVYARDRVLFRYDNASGKVVELYHASKPIKWIQLRPDGSFLVCTPKEGLILDKNGVHPSLRFPEPIRWCRLLENGQLMTVSQTGSIRRHDLAANNFLLAEITEDDGSTGAQAEMGNASASILYQDWTGERVYLGSLDPDKDLGFTEITDEEFVHQNQKNQEKPLLPRIRPGTGEIVTRVNQGLRFHQLRYRKVSDWWEYPLNAAPSAVAFDHSGNRALVLVNGAISTIELPSGKPQRLWVSKNHDPQKMVTVKGMKLSANGAYAGFMQNSVLNVIQVDDRALVFEANLGHLAPRGFCFHPKKPLLVYETNERLHFFDLEARQVSKLWESWDSLRWASFSPDGARLFTLSWVSRTAQVWDWEYDLDLLSIEHTSRAIDGDISADGLIFASTDHDPGLRIRFALPWWLEQDDPEFMKAVELLAMRQITRSAQD